MHSQLVIRELEQHSCSVVGARTHYCKHSTLLHEVCCQRGSLGLAAFLLMMLIPLFTGAQTLDEAVSGALDDLCAALVVRPSNFEDLIDLGFGPNLAFLCRPGLRFLKGGGFIPTSSSEQLSGGAITSQSGRRPTVEERRVQERLKDKRDAKGKTQCGGECGGASSNGAYHFNLGGLGVFVSGEYERFDKDITRFEPGYGSDIGSVTVGADYLFGKHFIAGIAFKYANINGEFDSSGGSFDTDSYGGLVYASFVPVPNFFADVVAGYAGKNYSMERGISFNENFSTEIASPRRVSANGLTSSNTDGDEYKAGISAGYDFIWKNFTVGPRLGVNYQYTTIDAFAEGSISATICVVRRLEECNSTTATGLELAYDQQSQTSLTSVLGMYASAAISTNFGVLVPQAIAGWVHEFKDSQRIISFRFVEDPGRNRFHFLNDPPDRNYANLGVGVSMILPHGISPFVNYQAIVGYRDQSSHMVTAGLRIEF
jgi:outer membrane autotransporter protein